MRVVYNQFTNEITGFNKDLLPFESEVQVNFKNITKQVVKPIGEVAKKNAKGEQLYKDGAKEVTTPTKLVKGEEVKLEPVIDTIYDSVQVDLIENPDKFTLEEVLLENYINLLGKNLLNDNILGDALFADSEMDLTYANHSANLSKGFIQLLPEGQCKTKSIILNVPSKDFTLIDFQAGDGVDIYISGKKFEGGKASLIEPVSSCTIKFVNTTLKPKIVKAYAIGY